MKKFIYSDEDKVNKIIHNINNDGFENLYFLADFDRTLTYSLISGEKKPSLISVIRNNPKYLGEKYSEEANRLFDYYHPIEVDINILLEEKKKKIIFH